MAGLPGLDFGDVGFDGSYDDGEFGDGLGQPGYGPGQVPQFLILQVLAHLRFELRVLLHRVQDIPESGDGDAFGYGGHGTDGAPCGWDYCTPGWEVWVLASARAVVGQPQFTVV